MKASAKEELELLVKRYPILTEIEEQVVATIDLLIECYTKGNKVVICGNGGSASDSLHIVGELMKDFAIKRPLSVALQEEISSQFPEYAEYYIQNLQSPLEALSLVNETALDTAYANDIAGELAVAQQVLGYVKAGDVLLAISTSGNSSNILHAARIAKILNAKVVALTGKSEGALDEIADITVKVPSTITYQIQELHLPIYHTICLALEQEFWGGKD